MYHVCCCSLAQVCAACRWCSGAAPSSQAKAFCPAGVADLKTVSQTLHASIMGGTPFRCPSIIDPAAMHQPEILQAVKVAVSLASYILICVDGTWQQAMEMFKVMLRNSNTCQGPERSHAQLCRYGVTAWSQLLNLLLPQAAQAKMLHKFDVIQRVQLQCSRWVYLSARVACSKQRIADKHCLSASCSSEAEQPECRDVLQRCILREPAPQCLTTLEALAR